MSALQITQGLGGGIVNILDTSAWMEKWSLGIYLKTLSKNSYNLSYFPCLMKYYISGLLYLR